MKTCPKCGRENQDSNKFCIGCGTKLEELPRFCPDCGAELEADSKFCPQCGFNIAEGKANDDMGNDEYEESYDNDESYDPNDDDTSFSYEDINDDSDDYEEYVDENEYENDETTEEKIVKILDIWLSKIVKESNRCFTKSNGTLDGYAQRIQNGLAKIGKGYISTNEVLGFIDLSAWGNSGKDAIIFTEKGIAFDYGFSKYSIEYKYMTTISLSGHELHFGSETIYRSHKDGKYYKGVDLTLGDTYLNLPALKDCLEEIVAIV